jgi:radical SAM protein with 4Fe4S-binding SPASM domain
MKSCKTEYFYKKIHQKDIVFPFDAIFELTYRCNLNCLHCYCQGSENKGLELSRQEIKRTLDELHQAGCIWLIFTGGEPLIREDFLEIYAYAKEKGFITGIFSNGQLFSRKIINYLAKSPPSAIEITLNGITKKVYEEVTQVNGSFPQVIYAIKLLKKAGLPLIIKTNFLKQNKNEIPLIKEWVEKNLGKPFPQHYFKYDPLIYPRLDGDTAPCAFRLSFQEVADILKKDQDMWRQYNEELHKGYPDFQRERDCLYQCNSWKNQFYINPFGRLKFCLFTEKFSQDLRGISFKKGFYQMVSQVSAEKFKASSECRFCEFRPICSWCPGRAYLETGNEEKPVSYYCQMAKELAYQTDRLLK